MNNFEMQNMQNMSNMLYKNVRFTLNASTQQSARLLAKGIQHHTATGHDTSPCPVGEGGHTLLLRGGRRGVLSAVGDLK
jgi:hypothetical protein